MSAKNVWLKNYGNSVNILLILELHDLALLLQIEER